jgi:hypothetical protein
MEKTRNAHKALVVKPEGKRNHSEDLGVDGTKILKWILGKQGERCVEWDHLVLDRGQWRAAVSTVMNLGVP